MGGKSPEYEVSLISGREVVKHLDAKKYEVFPVVISQDGQLWQLKNKEEFLLKSDQQIEQAKDLVPTSEVIRPTEISERADLVFIAMHGPFGEDGAIQGFLELVDIPYTGSGVLASALGMDKAVFSQLMASQGILTPEFLVLYDLGEGKSVLEKLQLPLVVKPCSQGSSVGVSIVKGEEELHAALQKAFSYGRKVIVEEFIKGTEVTCGILGNKQPVALPVVEIISKNEFFDYEAKYFTGKSEEIVPARISPDLTEKVQETALKVFKTIGGRGFGRVDMIIKDGVPYVLEINTIPGLTPSSLLPKEAEAMNIDYPRLLDNIIELALEKED